jgi:hypothetical protein
MSTLSPSVRLADVLGAVAGVLFALLIFLSVASVDPQRGVSDQELQSWWADGGNRDGFVISMYTLLVASPLFLLFASRLRTRLRTADAGGWADVVFASGIVITTALGVCAIIRGVIAGAMRFDDEPLPGVDTLRFATSLSYAAWDLVFLFIIVLVAIVSILAISTQTLPRWIGWLGLPVALGCFILFAIHRAPFAIPLVIVWVVANSFHLWRSSASQVTVATQQPETLSAHA